jgi:hypothetical protein
MPTRRQASPRARENQRIAAIDPSTAPPTVRPVLGQVSEAALSDCAPARSPLFDRTTVARSPGRLGGAGDFSLCHKTQMMAAAVNDEPPMITKHGPYAADFYKTLLGA